MTGFGFALKEGVDRCFFRSIHCFLLGTRINSCPDLLFPIRLEHSFIIREDSQFDTKKSGRPQLRSNMG